MDIQLLTQADFVLSKCGRPVAPTGLAVVYIPKGFLVQQYFGIAPATATQSLTKEITGDATWCLRAISMLTAAATAVSVQIQLPNGKFLISNLQDCLQIAGYGSYRYLFTKELECPPGSKIQVTLQYTNVTVAQPLSILFEGAYKYWMKSGQSSICPASDIAAQIPRIFGGPSQNIMAPAWQQGVGPRTPKGYRDEEFVYSSVNPANGIPGPTAIPLAGPLNATATIPIDMASEFRCRKRLIAITADGTVNSGTVLAKFRTGSGYSLDDDYFDVATYINGAPMPLDWRINAADSVYADLQLCDFSGTGNIYFQAYLEGFKRWRVAA